MRFFCPLGHSSQRTKTSTPNTKGGRRIATIVAVDTGIARVLHFVATVPAGQGKEATNEVLAHKEIVRVEDRPGVVVRRSAGANADLIGIASPVPNPSRCQRWTRRFARTTPRSRY